MDHPWWYPTGAAAGYLAYRAITSTYRAVRNRYGESTDTVMGATSVALLVVVLLIGLVIVAKDFSTDRVLVAVVGGATVSLLVAAVWLVVSGMRSRR